MNKENKYNYKITFSYDGSSFFGYQIQNDKRSVEEEIEKALSIILNINNIKIYSSGRTDKGVHAINQVANFFTLKKINDLSLFLYKINKLLPKDIYIKKIKEVSLLFSARLSSIKKEYYYLINYKEYDPLKRNYELYKSNIDLNKIKEVITLFKGEHNFINFTSKKEDKLNNYVRTIFDIEISKINNKYLKLTFIGNGFMRYEIRKIVGTILAYNDNKITLKKIKEYLDDSNNENNRKIINYQAPSEGLYLYKVYYK